MPVKNLSVYKKISKQQSGVSMVEIMIAVLIFGIALIPLITLFNSGNQDTVRLKNLTVATNIIREVMETVKALPYDLIQPDMELWLCEENPPDPAADPNAPAPSATHDAQPLVCNDTFFDNFTLLAPGGYYDKSLERYSLKVLIEPVTLPNQTCDMWGNDPSKLKKVSVSVKWKNKFQEGVKDRIITITTLINKLAAHSNSPYHATTPMVEKQYGR